MLAPIRQAFITLQRCGLCPDRSLWKIVCSTLCVWSSRMRGEQDNCMNVFGEGPVHQLNRWRILVPPGREEAKIDGAKRRKGIHVEHSTRYLHGSFHVRGKLCVRPHRIFPSNRGCVRFPEE